MALLHGSFEEKYEVLARLRQGGMGAVYKVRHRLLDELRAVKVIRSWAVGNAEAAARFLQEARVASRLRHPNLAVLHDFAVDEEGDAYLVTELIDGWTFREVLRRLGPPPLAVGLEMGRQALRALGHLHRHRIVHRDVSPDNLMLTRDADGLPLVKLIDLGIAKALEDGPGATEAGVFLGKPRYASPEQFGDAPVDERSDLYSLGVVLYELLTARSPIAGHDPLSLMAGHLSRPPLPFEESDPDGRIPDDLRRLLLDALEKRPDDRIPTADDFAGALAEIQARHPVSEEDLAAVFGVPAPVEEVAEAEASESLRLRVAGDGRHTTRSEMLPLAVAVGGADGPSVDDLTWGGARRPDEAPGGLVYEPLAEPADDRDDRDREAEPDSSPMLFRLALATAALLLLFVVARELWPPSSPPPARKAPEWAAVPPAPKREPKRTPPPVQPAEKVAEAPRRVAEAPAPAPAPVVVAEAPAPPPARVERPRRRAPEPESTPKVVEIADAAPPAPKLELPKKAKAPAPVRKPAPAPEPAATVAQRLPQPWEGGDQPAGLLKPGPGVEEPVPLEFPRYGYPTEARGSGLRADVRLALLVDERGKVIDARVREGAPSDGFAQTALAAARRIPFQPATRGDVPGKMWTEVILEFAEPREPEGR